MHALERLILSGVLKAKNTKNQLFTIVDAKGDPDEDFFSSNVPTVYGRM